MKIVIIGGGPGGYETAVRGAQLGADVTLIEKESLGGTCLNVGCIPTKALIHAANLYNSLKSEAKKNGIIVEGVSVDFSGVQKKKEKVVKQLVGGVGMLMKAYGVNVIQGTASFKDDSTITVATAEGEQEVPFDKAIIATGSVPSQVPLPGADLPQVVDSTGALSLTDIPESLCIIGGGVIGVELAHVYQSFGAKVSIVEMLPDILGKMDGDITAVMKKTLKRNKVKLYLNSSVQRIEEAEGGAKVVAADQEGAEFEIEAEKVLMCVGRKPYTEGLGLEALGIEMNRSAIVVDETFRTNKENIYAIGDCIGGIMLAHVASAEGLATIEGIMGEKTGTNFSLVPSCVYCTPEIGCVGLREEDVKEAGTDYEVGIFPLVGNGKSLIEGETTGLVKIVAEKETGKVLGVHMIGPSATELVHEGVLALNMGATVEDLMSSIHAHPTVGESIKEAAHSVFGDPINMPPQQK